MARLECRVTGRPPPVICWFRDSVRIEPAPDFLQFYDEEDAVCSLVIREVFPEDTGRYTVVAKNPAGTASCSAELVVLEGKASGLRQKGGYVLFHEGYII